MKIKSWQHLLGTAWHSYRKNSIILVPALVTVILSVLFQPFSSGTALQAYPFLAALIVSVIAGVYIKAAMLGIVGKSWKGRASLKECWSTANRKFSSLLGAEILILGILGSILLAGSVAVLYNSFGATVEAVLISVYGAMFLIAALFLSFTSYAVILSDKKSLAGARESAKFVQKNLASVVIFFVIMFALLAPVMTSVLFLQAGALNKTISTFLSALIMWLATPYFIFLQGYFYLAKKKK